MKYGCKDSDKTFANCDELVNHYISECEMTEIKCNRCNATMFRKEIKNHDCKKSLIERISELKSKQQEIKAKIDDVEKKGLQFQEPLTCYHGHPIKEFRDDEYEYMGGHGYGED